MKIAIDIGHAHQTGAIGCGLYEHTECAGIATLLYRELEKIGHSPTIIDFPTKSNAEDLRQTIDTVNSLDIDLGISLHCDCATTSTPKGAHVIYFPGSRLGSRFASFIAPNLAAIFPGRAKIAVDRTNLAILRHTKAPWILCECGFLTNPHDAAIIRDQKHLIASAIADGIAAAQA